MFFYLRGEIYPHKGKWRNSNYQTNPKPVGNQEAELFTPAPHIQFTPFLSISYFQAIIIFLASNLKHDLQCYWKSCSTFLTDPLCFPTTIKFILVDYLNSVFPSAEEEKIILMKTMAAD